MSWTLLSLRYKVLTGVVGIYLFMIATILGSYYFMTSLQNKIGYLEEISKVEEGALEIRRFEKNYFLYGDRQSLGTALYHLNRVQSLYEKNISKIEELISLKQSAEFRDALTIYEQLLKECSNQTGQGKCFDNPETRSEYERQIRKSGSSILEVAENLARQKRASIRETISANMKLLLLGLTLAGAGFVAIASFLLGRVNRSLRQLEKSAESLARGEFEPIDNLPPEKEIKEIFTSFNNMASKLREREEQLVQSKKLASLGTMLAGVAHEINNPLSNISSSCEILLEEIDETDKEFKKNLLRKVLDQVEKARTIVLNLLEFSRNKEFTLENLNLAFIIEKTLSLIQNQKPPGVQVISNVDPNLFVLADKQRIEQALINLITNAFHAIAGEGQVKIRGFSSKDGKVKIRISDTGRGISKENLARIFDPFFTTKDVGKGTGLGLFITHDIILRHKGTIRAESLKGQGTVFFISLPYVEPQ